MPNQAGRCSFRTCGYGISCFKLLILPFFILQAQAQQSETQAWIFLTHTQKLSKKFDLLADIQGRTADRLAYGNTLLLRSALSFNITKKHALALGYAYKADREKMDADWLYSHEHRIYAQYLYQGSWNRSEVMLRSRYEQRWLKEEGDVHFSQRLRGFAALQIPLAADSAFTRGLYAGLQDELFLNVLGRRYVNNSVFDQNRAFFSIGYRWSKEIDTEIGYMYWFQKEMDDDFNRHVIQLQITTNL